MIMDVDANEAFGEDKQASQKTPQYFAAKPVWIQEMVLHLVQGVDESRCARFAGIIEKGLEDARKRREAKRVARKEQQEREEREREHIQRMLREQEEAERKKRREAQKGRGRSKGLER